MRQPVQQKSFKGLFGSVLAAAVLAVGAQPAVGADVDRFNGMLEPIKAEKPFTMGVTLVHLQDDFWKGIAYGILDEAKLSGVEVTQVAVAGAYGNVREQFAQLDAMRTRGVDFAVVGPASFDGYDSVFRQLREAGTNVLAAGIPVNSANVTFGVGQDEAAIGAGLAKVVCEMNPDATVVPIAGPAGAEWARLRYEAFKAQAETCNGMTVQPATYGGALDLAYGMSQASDLLLRSDDVDVIYTPVIPLGMGAAQAVRQQGKDTKVVSSAIVREAIPMIKDGRLAAVASEPGILIGRLIVQYAIREHEGKELPHMVKDDALPYPNAIVPSPVITPENVDTYPFEVYDLPPQGWSITSAQ